MPSPERLTRGEVQANLAGHNPADWAKRCGCFACRDRRALLAAWDALEEMLDRGGRLIPNDGRDYLVVPHEETLEQARAALPAPEVKTDGRHRRSAN